MAMQWYDRVFSNITTEDHAEVKKALDKLRGKPTSPGVA